MNLRRFSLLPFPGDGHAPDVKITGLVGRLGNRLSLRIALLGDLSGLAIPAPKPFPARKHRLWEATCAELFLGEKNSGGYWEFNLSPSGDWNVYRFTSCREGMREEPAFTSLPFHVGMESGAVRLSLELDIEHLVPAGTDLDAAVCAVIQSAKGRISHWALAHRGPRPDFHRRDGFRLDIPGSCRPDPRSSRR